MTSGLAAIRVPARLWTLGQLVATVFFVAGTAVVLSTFLPGAPYIPVGLVLGLFFPTVFVVFFPAALWMSQQVPQRSFWGPWAALFPSYSRRFLLAAYGVFAIFWLTAMLTFPSLLRGNAEEANGHYQVNNHGSITIVDRTEYMRVSAAQERFMTCILTAFFGVAALVHTAARRQAEGGSVRGPDVG